jgi:hypothetical protein
MSRDPCDALPLPTFQENVRPRDIPGIRLPTSDKCLDLPSLVFTQFNHGYTPFFAKYSLIPTTYPDDH